MNPLTTEHMRSGHPAPNCSVGPRNQRGISPISVLMLVMIAAALYLGNEWYQVKDIKLSERPDRVSSTQPLTPTQSSMVASIFVSHATLQTALNGIAQRLGGREFGSAQVKCINLIFKSECLTAHWTVNYAAGSIGVSKAAEFVRLSLPVTFSGYAGFDGGIARAESP